MSFPIFTHTSAALPVMCPTIVPPRQGEMTCSQGVRDSAYPLGTTCTFTCGGGAALRGSRTTLCSPEGVWSTAVPTCQGLLLVFVTIYVDYCVLYKV